MTRIFNDPAAFAEEALEGFCDAHSRYVRPVMGGAVRRSRPARPKVAVIPGGGSGHYPAFVGLVGRGFADGAVVGNIFTSPSTVQAYSVAKAANSGEGVIFTYGNYAGDVMNFGLASEKLAAEGIRVENVIVTDDIASAPAGEIEKRRGIAGDFTVFKVMGAAAEAGASFDDVVRVGRLANDRTRTLGVAMQGCTFPGADDRLFTLEPGTMSLGLGIHGEPGLKDMPMPSAEDLAVQLVEGVLAEAPTDSKRIAVILNGLGSSKLEELFVLWRSVAPLLREHGYTLVAPEVGEIVTSLEMAGVSLTVTWLDDELEPLWLAPADAPGFRRGSFDAQVQVGAEESDELEAETVTPVVQGSEESRALAAVILEGMRRTRDLLHEVEPRLGDIDAVAGDGDHGRGMTRGIDAAHAAAEDAFAAGRGAGGLLIAAGEAWAAKAGGTSGVLWGAGLEAAGSSLGDEAGFEDASAVRAVAAFSERIRTLGGAELGDKTMVDALIPFVESLQASVAQGSALRQAWSEAAAQATAAADATAQLSPKKGRARPLAEKSVGTPDAGATSFALMVTGLASR